MIKIPICTFYGENMTNFSNGYVVFSVLPCSGLQSSGDVQKIKQWSELQDFSLYGPFTLVFLAGAKSTMQYHTINKNLQSLNKQEFS